MDENVTNSMIMQYQQWLANAQLALAQKNAELEVAQTKIQLLQTQLEENNKPEEKHE